VIELKMKMATLKTARRIVVRRSGIHGKGVFAGLSIVNGTRLIEYKGERISDEGSGDANPRSTHTFLFMLDNGEVIDGGRNGNSARWINHSCGPNCEATEENGRLFIDAVRHIAAGEEITIDYNLYLEARYTLAMKQTYACACRISQCRGTMLATKRKPRSTPSSPRI
jgi:SET domain-containing protein